MIKLTNVAYFDNNKPILRNINFTMNAQERVGIVGESGSGKTTLAHILLRLITPTKGQYDAHSLTMLPIFQHAIESFNTHLTLAQSLAEPKKYYKSINSNIDLDSNLNLNRDIDLNRDMDMDRDVNCNLNLDGNRDLNLDGKLDVSKNNNTVENSTLMKELIKNIIISINIKYQYQLIINININQ